MFDRRDLLLWSAASAVPFSPLARAANPAADPLNVLGDTKSADARLGVPKTLNGYFPFTPPKSPDEWAKRRQQVREQLLVALGLWPMPDKTPLNPVVHGTIRRGKEYTVEKVSFASLPGHYVTGNLYRPIPAAHERWGPRPAILCPHGHWANGRMYEAPDAAAKKEVETGAEQTLEGAKYPLQAGCVALARLGFVVFIYDMVGYADSTAVPHVLKSGVPHPQGFADAAGELRLQSLLGLQMVNAVRALDFLSSLPDVDPTKVGVTGASGGGTQTMLLGAIDDRPAAIVPMVMVSTAMQGGCPCENCSLLRVGTGNVEFAGLFAPKPLAMTGANDWTKEVMTKGYPELRQLYKVLGAEGNVAAKAWVNFPHNMNQPAREFMESWFAKHLLGRTGPVTEKPFVPVPPKELSVYDADHPRPADELDAPKLRAAMAKTSDAQMAKLAPTDAASLAKFRPVVGTALRVLVGELPAGATLVKGPEELKLAGGVKVHKAVMGRAEGGDAVPALGILGGTFAGSIVVWVHPAGKAGAFENGRPVPAVQKLLDAGFGVLAPDLLGTGEQPPTKPFAVDKTYAGFTFGYNRPLLAERVRDVLTAAAFARTVLKAKAVHVAGWDAFGPVAVLAKAAAGDAVGKTAADLDRFRFEAITDVNDPMMLPGAVKYGGLPAFLALCAPGRLLAHNDAGAEVGQLPAAAYAAAGAKDQLTRVPEKLPPEKVAEWLVG